MKRSRIGIRKRQKRVNKTIAILFLLILPIVAVAIGSRITKWWIVPTINTEDILKPQTDIVFKEDNEKKENPKIVKETTQEVVEKELDREAIKLDSISLYMIQVASISNNKNIELLIEELSNHNLPHTTYKLDDTYKIYTYVSTEREDIEEKMGKVKEIYEDAYMGQIHIPERQVHYIKEENDGSREVIENINLLLELLDKSSNKLCKSINGEIQVDEYKEILENHNKILGQITEKINNTKLPEGFASNSDIKEMVEDHKKNISQSLKLMEEGGSLHKVQNYFYDSLFKTIDMIQK